MSSGRAGHGLGASQVSAMCMLCLFCSVQQEQLACVCRTAPRHVRRIPQSAGLLRVEVRGEYVGKIRPLETAPMDDGRRPRRWTSLPQNRTGEYITHGNPRYETHHVTEATKLAPMTPAPRAEQRKQRRPPRTVALQHQR